MKPYGAKNTLRSHEPGEKIHGRRCSICYPSRNVRVKGKKFGRRGNVVCRTGWICLGASVFA